MVNYYIFAKDFSIGTEGRPYFNSKGMLTMTDFKKDVEIIEERLLSSGEPMAESKIIYLHWGSECYEVDENTAYETFRFMAADMPLQNPECMIEWIKLHCDITNQNNKIKLLYVITNGLSSPYTARRCAALNEDMHYELVVFHILHFWTRDIDLSITGAFIKGQCRVYVNYELIDNVDISEEFDYDRINIDNFAEERENITSYVKIKFLKECKHNAVALKEVDKLKKLRNRLLAELSSKPQNVLNDLNTKDRNVFLEDFKKTKWYTTAITPEQDLKINIEQTISAMINHIVSEKKSATFDALKFDLDYKKRVEEQTVDEDVNLESEQEIEFPDIILDDEKGIPVIILMSFNLLANMILNNKNKSGERSGANFNKFRSAMDCPLFLMKDKDISESIGYFYTLNAYKLLLENGNMTEPRTRRHFHGGLVLTDTDQFDKYNDYVLSATYFNSKKVKYNVGLFYYVLWKNCENKEWMDENVVARFKSYTLRRISDTVCRVGLTSLPLDPSENTSLPTALWYCVELSSRLFKDDAKFFSHERLRLFHGVAHYMIEILIHLNYDLDMELINRRLDIIHHAMILKKIPSRVDKVYYLLGKIFKNINGFLVSEIRRPSNIQKLNYLNLDHRYRLNDDVLDQKVDLNNYVHLQYHIEDFKDGESKVKICEKTFRPYFTIDANNSFYAELVKNTKQIVMSDSEEKDKVKITYEPIDSIQFDKMLSHYNLFINFVKQYEKYPTLPEYIEYILNKKKYHGELVTIFSPLDYTTSELVHSQYQSVVSGVDVKTFIEVTKKYVSRIERIKAEGILKFDNDDNVKRFLSSEESKVNMKTF